MKIKSRPNQNLICSISFLCIAFLFPSLLKSQNFLIAQDQSNFHSSVQISYNTFENYYAVQPGYTFDGRLTVGFDLGKTKDVVNKINSTVIRPNISYLLLKQNKEDFPFSLDLNFAYQFNYVSQVQFNARSIQFGSGLYYETEPLENVKIIPSLFFQGSKATSGDNILFKQEVVYSYGLQTTIAWNQFNLTPRLIIQDNVYTIGAKAGMIF